MNCRIIFTATAAALALSACDSEDVENTPIDDVDEVVDSDESGYPVAGSLNEKQQANLDAMDRQAATSEYEENRSGIMAERNSGEVDVSGAGASNAASGSSSEGNSPGQNMSASNAESAATQGSTAERPVASNASQLRPRRAMDFAFLDRNNDGKLSVAEYAIWAVRSDPSEPKPNDNTRPYTSENQINEAGQTFFYFDRDGDTYLSPDEFGAARSSAMTPN